MKFNPKETKIIMPVMFTPSTVQALEELKVRFPDEDGDLLINHAVQAFWARTCKQPPARIYNGEVQTDAGGSQGQP